MAYKTRHLRAVPTPGHTEQGIAKRTAEENYDRTLSWISDGIEELHELAAAKRTIRKHLARARACGAKERAAYLDVALDSLEEALNAK